MLQNTQDPLRKIRCAVYTRKSTEEGLEQDFNSLHAQREACESYIASQRHEGWVLLPKTYDDGGVSGGHMDRPSVQQLLDDVDAGLIDQIVVYKVDRLTRSLTDFSKLVERLDAAGASFVSVTQSFNTSTSMGRLTLNMLLSFAQFEREVTAERIRDKISSSKAKGMWMGGTVPFGYQKEGRTLVIREEEAAKIRHLFKAYADGMTIVELAQHCIDENILSRRITLKTGQVRGGIPYTRGPLNYLLKNPLYIGKIRHKGNIYEGMHPAIIDQELWDRVQKRLDQNTLSKVGHGKASKSKLPLLGLLYDQHGQAFKANHARKGGRRFDYYVSFPPNRSDLEKISRTSAGSLRYSARMLEDAVGQIAIPHLLLQLTGNKQVDTIEITQPETWLTNIESITVQPGQIDIKFTDQLPGPKMVTSTFTQRRRKNEQRLIVEGKTQIDETLLKNLALAQALYQKTKAGMDMTKAAQDLGIASDKMRRLTSLMFLDPALLGKAVQGSLPGQATSKWFERASLPLKFDAQMQRVASLA